MCVTPWPLMMLDVWLPEYSYQGRYQAKPQGQQGLKQQPPSSKEGVGVQESMTLLAT